MFLCKKEELNNNLCLQGFYQALGVVTYCSLVGVLFWKGNQWFGKVPNYLGPLMFLVLFVVSALICALIVFYKPYLLFMEKNNKTDAVNLIVSTTGWLFLFLLLIMLLVYAL